MNHFIYKRNFRVSFHQADPAGIMYFANLFTIAHETFEEWIEKKIGIPWKIWFIKRPEDKKYSHYLVPIRHTSCDFFQPFYPGHEYTIEVLLSQLRESSFEVEYTFYSLNKDETTPRVKHAVLKMVHAFMDKKTKKKMPIPPPIRKKLEPYHKWWAQGIHFQCQGSGKCCVSRGEYGYVFLTPKDRVRLAQHLKLSRPLFEKRYCDKWKGNFHLKEEKGRPECIFLDQNQCKVYEARPSQCRTWPFWPEVMNQKSWTKEVQSFCPGIGKGPLYSCEEIDKILRLIP